MNNEKKIDKCKFSHLDFNANAITHTCIANGWKDDEVKVIVDTDCELCENYKSRYIEYPIEVLAIDNSFGEDTHSSYECGMLVKIRPCGDEYKDKTFLGLYLGDLPIGTFVSHHPTTKVLSVTAHRNPAFFVPELKKVIYGIESWWGKIKDVKELKEISDKDIDNIWYVQLLKSTNKLDNHKLSESKEE